jgi:hypothetical protein
MTPWTRPQSVREQRIEAVFDYRGVFLCLLHGAGISKSRDPAGTRDCLCSLRFRRGQGSDLCEIPQPRVHVSSWRAVQERSSDLAYVAQVIRLPRFADRADRVGGSDRRLLAPPLVRRFPGRNWRRHASSGDRDVDHLAADLNSFLCLSFDRRLSAVQCCFVFSSEPRRKLEVAPAREKES